MITLRHKFFFYSPLDGINKKLGEYVNITAIETNFPSPFHCPHPHQNHFLLLLFVDYSFIKSLNSSPSSPYQLPLALLTFSDFGLCLCGGILRSSPHSSPFFTSLPFHTFANHNQPAASQTKGWYVCGLRLAIGIM